MAQKFLSEGKHEDSIPAALHSLKFHISVYGSHSVELVPAFIILAEASLGEFAWNSQEVSVVIAVGGYSNFQRTQEVWGRADCPV